MLFESFPVFIGFSIFVLVFVRFDSDQLRNQISVRSVAHIQQRIAFEGAEFRDQQSFQLTANRQILDVADQSFDFFVGTRSKRRHRSARNSVAKDPFQIVIGR